MAKRALGTTISINAVLIGGLTNIKSPERSADTIDTTTLDSSNGYREFIQGFKDGGEVQVTGFYDNSYTGQSNVDTAYENGTEDTYIITFPSALGATFTFTGVVTKLLGPGEANLDDPLGFEATIKVKGKPTLGSTASGGLTALSLNGTAGALSPAFNNAKYFYSHSFTTDASITVTPTAASHTIKLYVDDVYVEDVATGVASSAIAGFTAASSKKITLITYEAGKRPKVYTIVAIRAS